jgi:3-oxoacyl-[acyl-carrier-protein] synthase-1
MKVVYRIADNIISSLGFSTAENMSAINHGQSGVVMHANEFGVPEPFQASAVSFDRLNAHFGTFANVSQYTGFERLVISSVREASTHTTIDLASPETLFVISTTKGNVYLLDPAYSEEFNTERVNLWAAANEVISFFKNPNTPVIVSQACISGVSAILVAKMYLESGKYRHVVVTGADVLSKFVVSGFQSFKALSPGRCRPFDASRDGLSLGEGAATIILGIANENKLPGNSIAIKAGATSNDANHISGPSRTGEGLYRAIMCTMKGVVTTNLAFINAHGTATTFNDEMEAVALSRACLEHVPVNSLKGYIGHTLGAAGLIETIVCSHSLLNAQLVKCLGFVALGVSKNIQVITEARGFEGTECLKMASGFGGCNAVVLLKKYD